MSEPHEQRSSFSSDLTRTSPEGSPEERVALSAGEVLAGRYRIVRLLGRGGMGEVYEAQDTELDTSVALKTLSRVTAGGREHRARFKREVMLGRRISHSNVCRIHDLGWHRGEDGELAFLTMELLEGITLHQRLQTQGRLREAESLPLVSQMAAGLAAAHLAGVVHRDFKSGNVMLVAGDGERAVITDFGLARAAADDAMGGDLDVTGVSVRVGTPAYMAPEQIMGGKIGPRTDVYALGIVLYEMVTGALPFRGKTVEEVMARRIEAPPPRPRAAVPALSERWEQVILRCLARHPQDRFASALEVAAALGDEAVSDGTRLALEARHTLPAELDSFVGREEELAALTRRQDEGARLLTLLGAAGAGKTRLARRLGWRRLADFPGGVWFCDLSEARTVDGIASAVATTLDVPLGREDPVVQLGHALAGRGRCLVILDNLEQVVAHAEATLGKWVSCTTEAAFVVTSRARLGLTGEETLAVEPLPAATAGVELLVERARVQDPGFQIDGKNRAVLEELVRRLDGLPLAIELAAARVRVLPPARILERLQDRFRLLATGRGDSRQASLRLALDWSWELLAPWEQSALAQCSVFEGGFTLEAAEEVLDLSAWTEAPWPMDAVQSLLDRSLLRTWTAPGGEPRFGMYGSVQEYAREKLREAGTEEAAMARHGEWFARLGSGEFIASLDFHGGVARRLALAAELENLVAACRRAIARSDGGTAAACYRAAWMVVELTGPLSLGVELGRQALACDGLSPPERVQIQSALGTALRVTGHLVEAQEHMECALSQARDQGDRLREGHLLSNLGILHVSRGHPESAREHFQAALAIVREVGDRCSEGRIIGNLGGLLVYEGNLTAGRERLEAGLAIHREVGNRKDEAAALGNLGIVCGESGDLEKEREHLEAALAVFRELGDRCGEALVIGNLGNCQSNRGDREAACEHYEAALAIYREVGNRGGEGTVLCNLGNRHLEEGLRKEGIACYEAAHAIAREVGDRRVQLITLAVLGTLYSKYGDPEEGLAAFQRGGELLREGGYAMDRGAFLARWGRAATRAGDWQRARACLANAESIAAETEAGPETDLGSHLARLREELAAGDPDQPPGEE